VLFKTLLDTQTEEIRERIREFGETESQALSFTFIRMIPVAISLIGTKLHWTTVWFIGWFGPRGIASVLYLLITVIELGISGYEKMAAIITLP
jgi:NhaP-type Na+/H+ or K+/H+ antiporter